MIDLLVPKVFPGDGEKDIVECGAGSEENTVKGQFFLPEIIQKTQKDMGAGAALKGQQGFPVREGQNPGQLFDMGELLLGQVVHLRRDLLAGADHCL